MQVVAGHDVPRVWLWIIFWAAWGLLVGAVVGFLGRSPAAGLGYLAAGGLIGWYGVAISSHQFAVCRHLIQRFMPARGECLDPTRRFLRGPFLMEWGLVFGASVTVGFWADVFWGGLFGAIPFLDATWTGSAARGTIVGILCTASALSSVFTLIFGLYEGRDRKRRPAAGSERHWPIVAIMIVLAPPLAWSALFLSLVERPFASLAAKPRQKRRRRVMAELEAMGARVGWNGNRCSGVNFAGTRIGDEDLAILRSIPETRGLNVAETGITDAGLAILKGLPRLESLDLSGTAIGDAGIVHLRNLDHLEYLDLARTKVTDVSLPILKTFAKLREIELEGTGLTPAGRAELLDALPDCGIDNLDDEGLAKRLASGGYTWIRLDRSRVTDEGLSHLAGLESLEYLNLSHTAITDAGLAHLRGLTGLTSLNVSSTTIGDAGLLHLAGLPGLRNLYIGSTKVTYEGVARLKAALPDLEIDQ